MSDRNHRIGIDLGGTRTEAIALDDSDEVLYRKRIATARIPTDPDAVVLGGRTVPQPPVTRTPHYVKKVIVTM